MPTARSCRWRAGGCRNRCRMRAGSSATWLASGRRLPTRSREAIALCGRPADDIKAVAATAHGDGLYLLDKDRRPLGPGILSLDSRAGEIVEKWSAGPVFDEALALTGQAPHVSAPSALLAWLKQNDPDRYARIGHMLACKDWLRFCLTGTIGTDRTEASTSFTDFRTQAYRAGSDAASSAWSDLFDALPPVAHSADIVGQVTAEAAEMTGLRRGYARRLRPA